MPDVKRVHYFDGQLLVAGDLNDEQRYHIDMRRRHNGMLHSPGIAQGLTVTAAGGRDVRIEPGLALDAAGREIVISEAVTLPIDSAPSAEWWATLKYAERVEDSDRPAGGGQDDFGRITEAAEIVFSKKAPSGGDVVILARIESDASGNVRSVDLAPRRMAGVGTANILDEAVTVAKLAPGLRQQYGWVRMAFKPHEDHEHARPPFLIGPTEAKAKEPGAIGSMSIPCPPAASRVTAFRIAGEMNHGELRVKVYRCGWDALSRKHVRDTLIDFVIKSELVKPAIDATNPFEVPHDIAEGDLDRAYNALVVQVEATARCAISLVAARFVYELREYELRSVVTPA